MEHHQFFLALFSILGMACTQMRAGSPFLKWGCIFGLLSQPFWFYASLTAQQDGNFIVNIAATAIWLRGLWIFWIAPWRSRRKTPVNTIVLVQGVNTDESRSRNH